MHRCCRNLTSATSQMRAWDRQMGQPNHLAQHQFMYKQQQIGQNPHIELQTQLAHQQNMHNQQRIQQNPQHPLPPRPPVQRHTSLEDLEKRLLSAELNSHSPPPSQPPDPSDLSSLHHFAKPPQPAFESHNVHSFPMPGAVPAQNPPIPQLQFQMAPFPYGSEQQVHRCALVFLAQFLLSHALPCVFGLIDSIVCAPAAAQAHSLCCLQFCEDSSSLIDMCTLSSTRRHISCMCVYETGTVYLRIVAVL